MKYYSEETVRDIMREVEDATTAYFWGKRENNPDIEDKEKFPYIELPDKHGQLIDRDAVLKEYNHVGYMWQEVPRIAHEEFVHIVYNAPVVLERTT